MLGVILDLISSGIAGWLAGKIMNSEGSILMNVIIGLIGGVVGSVVFGIIGFTATNIIGSVIVSVVGACICIFVYNKFIKK
ncbi:MAG: GlsB/YeaQ/YmgE family stress response membrane protein [Oscillospiraceae bacterium]|nr:GlsB/YeaQ/YmgE family stress response membrane protein [Oscillospiraceae bacterium]